MPGNLGHLSGPQCASMIPSPIFWPFSTIFATVHPHPLLPSGMQGYCSTGNGKPAGMELWDVGRGQGRSSAAAAAPSRRQAQLLPLCKGVGVSGKPKLIPMYGRWRLSWRKENFTASTWFCLYRIMKRAMHQCQLCRPQKCKSSESTTSLVPPA